MKEINVNEILNEGKLANITFYGKYDIPAWTLLHYCKITVNNCIKLTTILNMLKLIENGVDIENFAICTKSKDLYFHNNSHCHEPTEENLIRFTKKNGREFLRILIYLERPDIFVNIQNIWLPIYQDMGRTSIRVRKISVESPATVNLIGNLGLAEILHELRFGKEINEREKKEWKNRQEGIALDNANKYLKNIQEYLKLTESLNNPNISSLQKRYIEQTLILFLNKQSKLNKDAGFEVPEISILA